MVKLYAVPLLSVFMVWSLYVVDLGGQIYSLEQNYVTKSNCEALVKTLSETKDIANKRFEENGSKKGYGYGVHVDYFGCAKVEWRPPAPVHKP